MTTNCMNTPPTFVKQPHRSSVLYVKAAFDPLEKPMTMNAPQMTSVPRTSPWPTRLAQAAIHRRMGAFLLPCLPIVLAACGGGGEASTQRFEIGGSVSGLSAGGLVLTNNRTDDLSVATNATRFAFATPLAAGAAYQVAIKSQPAGLTCNVSAGSGTTSGKVDSVQVACAANGGSGGSGAAGGGSGGGGSAGGSGGSGAGTTTRTFDGSAADCFNPEFFTPGTTYRWALKNKDLTMLQEGRIVGNASFNGQSDLVEDQRTLSLSSSKLKDFSVTTLVDYSRLTYRNSKPVITDFGQASVTNMTVEGGSFRIENESIYSPAAEYLAFTLAKGESYAHSETSNDTTRTFLNGTPVPGVGSQQNTESYKTTYLGQEKVTIAAGTFTACKFQDDHEATEYWVHRGSGIPLVLGGDDGEGNRVRFEMSTATSHVNNKTLTAYENGN